MRFIHTADLHLNIAMTHASFNDADVFASRRREHQRVLKRLIDYGEKRTIDALFIAGDMFDDPRITALDVEHFFGLLSDAPFATYLIIGNHDTFLHGEKFQALFKHYGLYTFDVDTTYHDHGDVRIHGINTRDFSPEAFSRLTRSLEASRVNVCLLHGDVHTPGDDHYLVDEERLDKSGFDYIALGHIHKHQRVGENAIYSGNPEPLDFSETAKRGIILGEITNKQVDAEFVPFSARDFIRRTLTIDSTMSEAAILDAIEAIDDDASRATHFYRVTLEGEHHETLEIEPKKLQHSLQETFHYIEITDQTTAAIDFARLKAAYPDTVIEALIEGYENEKNPSDKASEEVIEALRALLQTEESL